MEEEIWLWKVVIQKLMEVDMFHSNIFAFVFWMFLFLLATYYFFPRFVKERGFGKTLKNFFLFGMIPNLFIVFIVWLIVSKLNHIYGLTVIAKTLGVGSILIFLLSWVFENYIELEGEWEDTVTRIFGASWLMWFLMIFSILFQK